MPPGISLETGMEMGAELRRTVREFPEVTHVVTELGRNDEGTDPWTPSHIEADVLLRPQRDWPSGGTTHELIKRVEARLRSLPGYDIHVSQPIIESVTDPIFDVHSQLIVRIFGDDFNEMRRIGNDVISVLKDVPGTADVVFDIDQFPPLPQIAITSRSRGRGALRHQCRGHFRPDPDRDRRWRRQPGLHRRASLRHDGPLSRTARDSPEAIGNLVLTSSTGALIPLSQVARIQFRSGESTINRWMNSACRDREAQLQRSRPALAPGRRAEADRRKGLVRSDEISPRMGRRVRESSSAQRRVSFWSSPWFLG